MTAARRSLVCAALLGLAVLAGPGAAHAQETTVGIRDYKFVPETLTVKAGTTVRWTNDEKRTSHSVVFPAEGIASERLLPEDTWQRTFERPGRYPYTCDPHAEMKGLVIVE